MTVSNKTVAKLCGTLTALVYRNTGAVFVGIMCVHHITCASSMAALNAARSVENGPVVVITLSASSKTSAQNPGEMKPNGTGAG
jgi:hypothetical protein